MAAGTVFFLIGAAVFLMSRFSRFDLMVGAVLIAVLPGITLHYLGANCPMHRAAVYPGFFGSLNPPGPGHVAIPPGVKTARHTHPSLDPAWPPISLYPLQS